MVIREGRPGRNAGDNNVGAGPRGGLSCQVSFCGRRGHHTHHGQRSRASDDSRGTFPGNSSVGVCLFIVGGVRGGSIYRGNYGTYTRDNTRTTRAPTRSCACRRVGRHRYTMGVETVIVTIFHPLGFCSGVLGGQRGTKGRGRGHGNVNIAMVLTHPGPCGELSRGRGTKTCGHGRRVLRPTRLGGWFHRHVTLLG